MIELNPSNEQVKLILQLWTALGMTYMLVWLGLKDKDFSVKGFIQDIIPSR